MKSKKKGTSSRAGDEDEDDAKSAKSKKSSKADQETADQINRELEQLKFEIPSACMLAIPKHAKIEKLEAKYLLLAHPFPVFQGQIIMAQPKKDD